MDDQVPVSVSEPKGPRGPNDWAPINGRSMEEENDTTTDVLNSDGEVAYTLHVGYKRKVDIENFQKKTYNPSFNFSSLVGSGGVVDHTYVKNPITHAVTEIKTVETKAAWVETYRYSTTPPATPEE